MNGQSLFHAEEMTTNGAHVKIFLPYLNIKAIVNSSKHFDKYSVEVCICMYIFYYK